MEYKPPHILTEQEKDNIKTLYKKHIGMASLATHLAIPFSTIRKFLYDEGLIRERKSAVKDSVSVKDKLAQFRSAERRARYAGLK